MMICPHWQLRQHMKFIRTDGEKKRYEARFNVLMFLIFSVNPRLRTWPGIETIMEETGFERAPVIESIDWLEKHGFMYNVPSDKRIGKEKELHGNCKVWQLTGLMEIEGKVIEYLCMRPEDRESILEEIKAHGRVDVVNLFEKLSSQNEPISRSDTEISSQNQSEYAKLGSQNELEISSQRYTEVSTTSEVKSKAEVEKQAQPAQPIAIQNIQAEEIIKLIPHEKPDVLDVKIQLQAYSYAWILEAVNKGKDKAHPWKYALATLKGWRKEGREESPPSSSGAVSPSLNGKHELSDKERQQREAEAQRVARMYEQNPHLRPKKASGT